MNKQGIFIFFLILFGQLMCGQTLSLPLANAGLTSYRNHICVYGLFDSENATSLKIYTISENGSINDSLTYRLADQKKSDAYLRLSSDTLHGAFSIYLQEKESHMVRIFRIGKHFRFLDSIHEIESPRLNSTERFGHSIKYTDSTVYSINQTTDSNHVQYFLSRFKLKPQAGNYDYTQVWRFPYERSNIEATEIVSASRQRVHLYVRTQRDSSSRQWILTLNAKNGQLIKGTRMNLKHEKADYALCTAYPDTVDNSLRICGMHVKEKGAFSSEIIPVYYLKIDSAGNVALRQTIHLPVVKQAKNGNINLLIRPLSLTKESGTKFKLQADLFSGKKEMCFKYCNTIDLHLTESDEEVTAERIILQENPTIASHYNSNDPQDMNGKICRDSSGVHSLWAQSVVAPAKIAYFKSESGFPIWLLKKSDNKKQSTAFSVLQPENKIYQTKKLENIPMDQNPAIAFNQKILITGAQSASSQYIVKIFFW